MGLFRNRGFALLWTGQLFITAASWSMRTVMLIWVYGLAHSGVAVSLVGAGEALPLLLLAPIGGVYVDRLPRAGTMAVCSLLSALVCLPLLWVNTRAGIPLLLAVAVAVNAAVQMVMTASGAAIPVVAGAANTGQANSLTSLLNGGVAVVAPGVGALLFGTVGPHVTVLILVGVLLLAAPIFAFVPAPRAEGKIAENSVAGEMRAGLAYVRHSRLLLSLVAVASVAALSFGALSVLDVVFVTRALHLPSSAVGILLSASGLGELAGGLLMSIFAGRLGNKFHLLLGGSAVIGGCGLLAYSASRSLVLAAITLSICGFMFPPVIVAFMTMQQRVTEDAFMGRVNSIVSTSMGLMMLLSLASGGALTDLFGVRQVIAGGGLLFFAAGVLSLLTIRSTPPTPVEVLAPGSPEERSDARIAG